jgi:hypothetical protein
MSMGSQDKPAVMFGQPMLVAFRCILEYPESVRGTGMRPSGASHLGQPTTLWDCLSSPPSCLTSPFDFT